MATLKTPPLEPPPGADDPEQSRRFLDIAREVGADETPGALDRALDKVIRAPRKKPEDGETSQ